MIGTTKVRVKIADVARHARVGAGTVSRVLNGAKNVSRHTRERVQASINALEYVPNLVARGLAANRTGIIAAVVPSLGYSLHAEIIEGVTEFLHDHGITLMIGHAGYDLEVERQIVSAFLARRPDAFYVTGIDHSEATRRLLKESGVPVVEGGNLTDTPIDCVVGYSNFEAVRQLTHLLYERGHRHIVHVNTGAEMTDRNRDRQRGYETAHAELKLSKRKRVLAGANSLDGGARAVAEVLALGRRVDALQCGTDLLAVGAIFECQRRGIAVPEQLAISGFDDLPIARSIVPPLTTVKIDRKGLGRRIGRVLLQRLSGDPLPSKVIDVGFQIVERASTRPSAGR
jgi:LacI family transcriptional regulator, gluconate utilization system Gnt-I transcriptional repressor